MQIRLNDKIIDWVKFVPKNATIETTEHTIQLGNMPNTSTYARVKNREVKLECIVETNTFGTHKKKYDDIYEMSISKEDITLDVRSGYIFGFHFGNSFKYKETYLITSLEVTEEGENFIHFNMTLKARYYSTLKTQPTSIQPEKFTKSKASLGKTQKIAFKDLKEMNLGITVDKGE